LDDHLRWIDVAGLDEIAEDRPLARSVGRTGVALLRRGDQVVAVLDRCPHMDFPLSQGRVHEGRLECSLHHWRFDVFEDPPDSVPPEARCVHVPVRVVEGRVLLGAPR